MERIKSFLIYFCVFVTFFWLSLVKKSYGGEIGCKSSFIDLIKDVHWEGVFPIEIAGVEAKRMNVKDPASEGLETNPDKLKSVMCVCKEGTKLKIGLTASYWEPARVVETTKMPFCFPTLGIRMSSGSSGKNLKTTSVVDKNQGSYTSYNSHYYLFDVLDILDLFVDVPCVYHDGFDIAYISEIDPLWNNDVLAFVLNPEAILFGNPVAQLACFADSVASLASYPINSLFWCIGSWGPAYPLAGTGNNPNPVEGSALIAAKTIYRNARMAILWDTGVDVCYRTITPVLVKTNYKIQLLKPVKGPIIPLGRTALLWDWMKNPPFGTSKNSPDNFAWLVFRRVKCCLGKTIN